MVTPSNLENMVIELKKSYLGCQGCPPERNCCDFRGRYINRFPIITATEVFGKELIDELMDASKLRISGHYYILQNTVCPAFDSQGGCRVHDRKEELGVINCSEFPIWVNGEYDPTTGDKVYEGEVKKVVVDYRCFGVERNWNCFEPTFKRIDREFATKVIVKYYAAPDEIGVSDLLEFIEIRKGLPEQAMILSKYVLNR